MNCFKYGRLKIFRVFFYKAAFNRLLEHRCPICEKHSSKLETEAEAGRRRDTHKFSTFRALEKHVRVEHDLYYCELCTGHLKVILFCHKIFEITFHFSMSRRRIALFCFFDVEIFCLFLPRLGVAQYSKKYITKIYERVILIGHQLKFTNRRLQWYLCC